MSTQVQRRKGTTVQHSTFTGASAELTVDTTKNTVVVHNGATAGGIPLAKETGSAISATSLSLPNSTTNGVAYVNGSKVVVAGSVLTFDGNDLSVNGITVGKGAAAVSTNTAVGNLVMGVNVNGAQNTAVGYTAMKGLTTGNANTAVGTVSLWTNSEGIQNTAVGWGSLFPATGNGNTAVGHNAGGDISSGAKNTIIGRFSGNGGGLDIRTASNYVVLSDGDANPRAWWNGANPTFPGAITLSNGTANGVAYLNASKVLTSGTALVFDGTNLGIGTTSPSGKLMVKVGTDQNLNVTSTGGILQLQGINDAATVFAPIDIAGSYLRFSPGATERMRLDASGRLLVGKTSGVSAVDVVDTGSGGVRVTSGTTDLRLLCGASAAYLYNASAVPTIFTINTSEAMRIDASGNLGIGTTSPAAKLHVSGSIRAGSATDYAQLTQYNTNLFGWLCGPAGDYAIRLNTATANVGIGADPNASAALDVQSTTKGVRMPNMTTTQKNAIASPAAGLMVFDITLAKLCVYSGSAWQTITSI